MGTRTAADTRPVAAIATTVRRTTATTSAPRAKLNSERAAKTTPSTSYDAPGSIRPAILVNGPCHQAYSALKASVAAATASASRIDPQAADQQHQAQPAEHSGQTGERRRMLAPGHRRHAAARQRRRCYGHVALRTIHQTAAAAHAPASATRMPPSTSWNVQNRLSGW